MGHLPADHLRHGKVKLFFEWLRRERDAWAAKRENSI